MSFLFVEINNSSYKADNKDEIKYYSRLEDIAKEYDVSINSIFKKVSGQQCTKLKNITIEKCSKYVVKDLNDGETYEFKRMNDIINEYKISESLFYKMVDEFNNEKSNPKVDKRQKSDFSILCQMMNNYNLNYGQKFKLVEDLNVPNNSPV